MTIAVLDWLAQLIGSLSIRDLPSRINPRMGRPAATTTKGMTATRGRFPSQSTVRSTQPWPASFTVGRRRSRTPMIVVGSTTPATSRATMPSESSTPKSWTIGTREIFTVRKAITAATVAASNGGPIWARVSA